MPRLLGIFLAGLSPWGRRLPSPIRRDSRSKLAMSQAFRGKLGHRRLKSSGEDAVHKPARRRVAGKAGAVKPEAAALFVLDTVIIADPVAAGTQIGGGATFDPPFLDDALGPVGMPDPVLTSPPGEAERRIVRQHPLRLDRLRRPEQPHGAGRFATISRGLSGCHSGAR